jgi:hypothetical protein
MQMQSPARARATASAIGGDELAEGLMLVRASTLKMIRLQLAMERRDRRVALEEVDDLLALDRRLQDYLADVPAAGEQALWRGELQAERAALDREKWTLAGEVIRRDARAPAPDPQATSVEAPDAATWGSFAFAQDERERRKRSFRRFALGLVLLAVLGGAADLLASPETLAAIVAWAAGAVP